MGSELLSDDPQGQKSYSDIFDECFPYYLSIGMTCEEYWEGDSALPIFYRKAQKLRDDVENQKAWLQGMYFYEALCDVSPILHAFAKKGVNPYPYPGKPYGGKENEEIEENQQKRIENERLRTQIFMDNWVNSFKNKKQGGE